MCDTAFGERFSSAYRLPTWVTFLLFLSLLLSFFGCSTGKEMAQLLSDASAPPPHSADDLLPVDCLLPGQIKKLGQSMIYLTPRRPTKTSALDCAIRGGEYVAYDRSDYATALKVWLPQAQEGDKVAQAYVGEIYEKGLGVQPDYGLASEWYRKASEQGYARAQINLGYLYEKGMGVERDPTAALNWYRKAAGLGDAIALDPASIDTEARKELEELRREVERRKHESGSLRQQLEQARHQLAQTQQELERRKGKAETDRQQLEMALQELERRKKQVEAARDEAEVRTLEEQLKQRQDDLKRQQQEITGLHQKISQLERETERYGQQLDKLKKEEVALAGPTIEMIDPSLATRGIPSVKTRPGTKHVIVGRVTAPAGLLTFTVNNREEKVDTKGLFRVPIPVQRSSVPVTMAAIDKQGKRASVEFLLALEEQQSEPKAPQPPSPPVAEKKPVLPTLDFGGYYALIIGNKEYAYWPNLDTPKNDALKTAEVFSRKYGFRTKVLVNATRYDILLALHELRKTLTEKDNLLIYYAGHGHLDDRGRGYWVPVDGEIDSKANWIRILEITDIVNMISAKHVLVVADTCYAGILTESALVRLEGGIADEDRYNRLKIIVQKRSRTVLTSGDLKPVLDRGGGEHSIFAKAFLDVLRENAEILEGRRLYQEVSARVAYAASAVRTDMGPVEQVPRYAPIKYAGHESGDFLFVPTAK
jgi:multidrug efflux pump subunit AcrA (membrane-fusion protein)